MASKEKNINFIHGFARISVKGVCDKLNIARSNIFSGKASNEKLELVKEKIIEEIAKLFLEDK